MLFGCCLVFCYPLDWCFCYWIIAYSCSWILFLLITITSTIRYIYWVCVCVRILTRTYCLLLFLSFSFICVAIVLFSISVIDFVDESNFWMPIIFFGCLKLLICGCGAAWLILKFPFCMDYVESIKLYALITCCTRVTPMMRACRLINSAYTVCAGIRNINSSIYTDSRHCQCTCSSHAV